MSLNFTSLSPDSLIEIKPVVKDGSSVVTKGVAYQMTVAEFLAGVAATTTAPGTVKKAAAQTTFVGADITAVKVELNAFLVKLQNAGIIG